MIHKWISISCLAILLLISAVIMSEEEEEEEILPFAKLSFLLALFIPLLYVALH